MSILCKALVLLALMWVSSCCQRGTGGALTSFLDSIPEASVGLCIKEVRTGRVVEEYNCGKSLRPASVMKLLTTATALDYLKCDYRFKTSLAYSGERTGSTVNGAIVIKAGGDPTWNSRYFPDEDVINLIVSKIKDKGIRRITQGFIIDKSDINEDIPGTWLWEDIANYYGSPSYAINIFDNSYEIEFTSGKDSSMTKVKSVSPFLEDIKIENQVVASRKNRDNAWIFGSPFSQERLIKGSIPENRESFRIKGALPDPSVVFIDQLVKKMNKEGIRISPAISHRSNVKSTSLFDIESPELKDIVYSTNQKSINLFAESIGKRLLYESGESPGFDYNPTEFFRHYWNVKGINAVSVETTDMCGLSAFNMVSAEFMTDLLIYMSKNSNEGYHFIKSLPVAGTSGTLKNFGKGSCLENNLRAKTGSMKAVRSYCGYFLHEHELMAFTLIVNNYSCGNKKLINFISSLLKNYCD